MSAHAEGAERPRFADLGRRAASALVLAPAAILAVWLGAAAFQLMVAGVLLVLAWEWARLCGLPSRRLPGLALPGGALGAAAAAIGHAYWLSLALLGAAGAVAWASARFRQKRPLPALFLAAGVVYVGLAGVAMIWLRDPDRLGGDEAGRADALFLLAVVWASDIGGYAVGRLCGGPLLAPLVSPRKTWSGAIGALGFGLAAGLVVAGLHGSVGSSVPMSAAALGIAAQLGDLIESALKRRFHVKDSSGLIPGHGGVLDRLDGLIAAAPVAALLALQSVGERLL